MTTRSPFFRRPLYSAALALGLVFWFSAHAELFHIEEKTPKEFEDIQEEVEENIPEELDKAQCGGWNFAKGVDGMISHIEGLPGRVGIWYGNLKSGMARRVEDEESALMTPNPRQALGLLKDGYQFPNISHVWGWSSACKDQLPHHCTDEQTCRDLCARINRWQQPVVICNGRVQKLGCRENYGDARPPPIPAGCEFSHWEYCCTQNPVTQWEYENPFFQGKNHADQFRNCVRCRGDGLEDPHNPGFDFHNESLNRQIRDETGCRGGYGSQVAVDGAGDLYMEPGLFVSFYRKFLASFHRNKLTPEAPRDVNVGENIPVACYGFYDEFDPKVRKVQEVDRHCVIASDFSNREDTQLGKGTYGQNLNLPDVPLIERNFDEEEDLWFPEVGGAISLINSEVFHEDYDSSLTLALFALDEAKQEPGFQMTKEKPFSDGNLLRAFDDTVAYEGEDSESTEDDKRSDRRTIVEWWQEQETSAHTIFTPGLVHLILPALWSLGLDPLDPFFTPPEPSREPARDPQAESIEVQLNASEDLLGEISAYLERSMILPIEEVPLSIVVPMGSATEFRAIAESWCSWYKELNEERDCKGAPEDVLNLIEDLEEYANRIDYVRTVRTELPHFSGKLLDRQNKITETIGGWLAKNITEYRAYMTRKQNRFALQKKWQDVQVTYQLFHDKTNMPWCHNDRFTTPIYSQLDPWLPGRPDLTGGIFEGEPPVFDFDKLPRLLGERETDIYIDFSALKLPQQPIKIPVLRPIQISIDLQKIARPASDEKNPEVPKLPDLPDIPKIGKDKAESFIPSIEEDETPPTIRTFIPDLAEVDTNEISQILTAMKEILSGMDRAYDRFWSGVLQEGTEECQQIGAGPCVYTEMELIQTLTRLSDRPAVLLKDDFRSIGERRKPYEEVEGYAKCEREDWACQLLSGSESYPREGWHITESPIKEEKLDELFIELADEILKEKDEEDRFPYAVPLEKILPSYEVPGSFSILPKTEES